MAAIILLGMAGVVAFGTLFPFDFHCRGGLGDAFAQLTGSGLTRPGRGDLVANLLLFIPFGIAAAATVRRAGALVQILFATALGFALSLGVELAQTCLTRTAALSDVALNSISALVGGIGAVIGARLLRGRKPGLPGGDLTALLLLALFACWRLAPFIPTIDWQKWKNALKPLLMEPSLSGLELVRFIVLWLVALRLARSAVRDLSWTMIVLLLAAYFFARLLILGTVITLSELLGALIGVLLLGPFLARRGAGRAALIGLGLLAVIAYQGLQPFAFSATPSTFQWLPGRGYLGGSMLVNAASAAEKLFLYGAAVWLLVRAGLGYIAAGVIVTIVVAAIEYTQTWLPGRLAEITDPIQVVIATILLALLAARPQPKVSQANAAMTSLPNSSNSG